MEIDWTLNKSHVLGLIAYAGILPLALVASADFGEWILLIGALVSLPLAPVGFMAFWGGTSVSIPFAFFVTWLVNILLGWVMLVQYATKKRNKGEEEIEKKSSNARASIE